MDYLELQVNFLTQAALNNFFGEDQLLSTAANSAIQASMDMLTDAMIDGSDTFCATISQAAEGISTRAVATVAHNVTSAGWWSQAWTSTTNWVTDTVEEVVRPAESAYVTTMDAVSETVDTVEVYTLMGVDAAAEIGHEMYYYAGEAVDCVSDAIYEQTCRLEMNDEHLNALFDMLVVVFNDKANGMLGAVFQSFTIDDKPVLTKFLKDVKVEVEIHDLQGDAAFEAGWSGDTGTYAHAEGNIRLSLTLAISTDLSFDAHTELGPIIDTKCIFAEEYSERCGNGPIDEFVNITTRAVDAAETAVEYVAGEGATQYMDLLLENLNTLEAGVSVKGSPSLNIDSKLDVSITASLTHLGNGNGWKGCITVKDFDVGLVPEVAVNDLASEITLVTGVPFLDELSNSITQKVEDLMDEIFSSDGVIMTAINPSVKAAVQAVGKAVKDEFEDGQICKVFS